MKKLLIFMLVLGITSSASAVVVTLDPSGSADHAAGDVVINVVSDSDLLGHTSYIAVLDNTHGGFSSVVKLAGAGSAASVTPFGAYGIFADVYGIEAMGTAADPDFTSVVAGNQFTATIAFNGAAIGQDVTVGLLNPALDGFVHSYRIQGIPEPMTIALLGLGGLFLLRRRK